MSLPTRRRLNEQHLTLVLQAYVEYYNDTVRTGRSRSNHPKAHVRRSGPGPSSRPRSSGAFTIATSGRPPDRGLEAPQVKSQFEVAVDYHIGDTNIDAVRIVGCFA